MASQAQAPLSAYTAALARARVTARMVPAACQQIDQVQAAIQAVAQKQLPHRLPRVGFSDELIWRHLDDCPQLSEVGDLLADFRQVMVTSFGLWHLFTMQWVRDLDKYLGPGNRLELMAGNAALARYLPRTIATDNLDWHGQDNEHPTPWTPVEPLDAVAAVDRYAPEVNAIIMAWAPDQAARDVAVVQRLATLGWRGRLIVVGEKNGATNSAQFWHRVPVRLVYALNRHHQPVDFIRDRVYQVGYFSNR